MGTKTISTEIYSEILNDIHSGVFCYAENISVKYYSDTASGCVIVVTAKVDNTYNLIDFITEVIDEQGGEFYLNSEQGKALYHALEKVLQQTESDAKSEGEHIKHLWRQAYA